MRWNVFERFSKGKKFYLTQKGLAEIKREYQVLKKLRQSKVGEESPRVLHSDELAPEYLAFKEDLDLLELRIARLEEILKNVELIKLPPKEKQNEIYLGAKVSAEMDGHMEEFLILGTLEADPSESKISDESPIGKALLGKKIGETVQIKTNLVNCSCKIIKVKYDKI